MGSLDILAANLLSPIVLAFALGIVARLIKSDLEFPDGLYQSLAIYLLLAIGLKGGVALSVTPVGAFLWPALATLALGVITPLTSYAVLRRPLGFDRVNAAALSAHYGSVSAVTFIAALQVADLAGLPAEGYMPALVAILEVPAIIVALMLAYTRGVAGKAAEAEEPRAGSWQAALHEVVSGRSVVLLLGGLVLGLLAGEDGFEKVEPFFVGGFQGALVLFLLEMGLVTARRLGDLRTVGVRLIGFGVVAPIVHGLLGVWLGGLAGLSPSGAAVLGAMVASASYIAAPAAVRIALPEASPTLYLTAALAITFPFNLTLGIPLFFAAADWFA
ncbi:MAG: sodium-dependent bicarbonate transport family permease [Rhodothermales bacterium]|nr:sodium-dependent bicarbonate transport family permease [Rhodothermales bacterium]